MRSFLHDPLLAILIGVCLSASAIAQTIDSDTPVTSVIASDASLDEDEVVEDVDVLERRVQAELFALQNNFIIQQHHTNYILPFTMVDEMSASPLSPISDRKLQDHEAKFQISIKTPLYSNPENPLEGLYVAYTARSFWQIYNADVSRPFRETNYEPEVFYRWVPNWSWGDLNVIAVSAGLNHQSNGQINVLSRSWNRVMGRVTMQYDDYFALLTAWYRIPEDEKKSPDDSSGDDNPDITDYLGNFELTVGTRLDEVELSLMMRNNLSRSQNRGFLEATVAYPVSDRFDVMIQASKGYGDSLIDYNEEISRVSLGFRLSAF